MVRGVLFDLFGTVVVPFSRERHRAALARAAEVLGLDVDRCQAAWEADYERRVLGQSGTIAVQLSAIAKGQWRTLGDDALLSVTACYESRCAEMMTPVPTAVEALEKMAELGLPVGLVSNAAPDFAAAFERSPLRGYFHSTIFSCHVGVAKPDRRIYEVAADAMSVAAADILFVGDGSDNELAGADAAGLRAVLIDSPRDDTYDPDRASLADWSGPRIRRLADAVPLVA